MKKQQANLYPTCIQWRMNKIGEFYRSCTMFMCAKWEELLFVFLDQSCGFSDQRRRRPLLCRRKPCYYFLLAIVARTQQPAHLQLFEDLGGSLQSLLLPARILHIDMPEHSCEQQTVPRLARSIHQVTCSSFVCFEKEYVNTCDDTTSHTPSDATMISLSCGFELR